MNAFHRLMNDSMCTLDCRMNKPFAHITYTHTQFIFTNYFYGILCVCMLVFIFILLLNSYLIHLLLHLISFHFVISFYYDHQIFDSYY